MPASPLSQVFLYAGLVFVSATIVGFIYWMRNKDGEEELVDQQVRKKGRKRASSTLGPNSMILLEQTVLKGIETGDFEVELLLSDDGEVPMFNKMWRMTIRKAREGDDLEEGLLFEQHGPFKRDTFKTVA